MKIQCVKTELSNSEINLLGDDFYSNQEYHITEGREYLVLGLTICHSNDGNGIFLEIRSDSEHLISAPIYLFRVTDSRVSKYWQLKLHEDGSCFFWPPSFYKKYYHDDLSENVPEIVEDFNQVVKMLEQEYPTATSL